YKIEIQVFHGGNSCNFVFWNRECMLILGLSAAQIRYTMIKAVIDDPLEFPLGLDQLLNLEMEFKVNWQPHWNNFSVVRILRDEPFIRKLKAPWDINKVFPSKPGRFPSKTLVEIRISWKTLTLFVFVR
ncbi:hypothetical protein RYX36_012911, partial [Vicia faba]